ncbi:hypothetical protein NDU88_011565 [Pleurodeles waltl]|uniref:Uncharacterized protein n=1 Tax=Pleurodeles waltl TaxID=8319 RepID=A0AAV7QXM8_PLEWA|nr:hypothetical protein NDU88_011565 [Pleurodeles waltl]
MQCEGANPGLVEVGRAWQMQEKDRSSRLSSLELLLVLGSPSWGEEQDAFKLVLQSLYIKTDYRVKLTLSREIKTTEAAIAVVAIGMGTGQGRWEELASLRADHRALADRVGKLD